MTLDELNLEEPARVSEVGGQGALRRRLLDMGITPGTEVMIRKRAPMGDPIEIHLRGYELTLRIEDAKKFKWRRSGSNDFCTLGGNQNSGKTTLFNQLTGSNQHVGELSPASPWREKREPSGITRTRRW